MTNPFIIHGETPINFLNKLQRVKYRVNSHILQVAVEMRLRGRIVGKFIPISPAFIFVGLTTTEVEHTLSQLF